MAPGNNHVTAISSEIFKYVRIHPNFASQPVSCEKMFLCCCFFPQSREKRPCLFVKSFLCAFREKQHRNIFSHNTGRLPKFGWILTYLKISLEMAVTWLLPGAIQFVATKFGEFATNFLSIGAKLQLNFFPQFWSLTEGRKEKEGRKGRNGGREGCWDVGRDGRQEEMRAEGRRGWREGAREGHS